MDFLVGHFTLTSGILFTAVLALLIQPLIRSIYNLTLHPLAPLPGRKTWASSRLPFLWALIRGKLAHELEEMHRLYGPIVRVAPDEVAYAHPDAWNDILLARFPKDPTWWAPMPGASVGIVTFVDRDIHAAIRRQLSPGFTTRMLTVQEGVVHQYTDLLISRWRDAITTTNPQVQPQAEVDVMRWFNYLTFDIFGDLAFGESFSCLHNSSYHGWISLIFDNLKFNGAMIAARFYPLVDSLLAKLIPASLQKAKEEHAQLVADKVKRRMEGGEGRIDIMTGILEGKETLPVGIVNQSFTELVVAGSETTAMALSGAVNLLIHDGRVMERLVEEVRGRFKAFEEIDVQGVRDMVYLNAVLNEVLRLCPPVPLMPPRRVPEGGGTVCGRVLPGGTRVSITFTSMHREPTSFHDPNSFHPERWLPEATSNPNSPFFNDKRHASQPFTLGPHVCIGQNLAWAEMRLVLAKVLWTFDLEAPLDLKKRVVWEDLKTFLLIEKAPLSVVVKERAV